MNDILISGEVEEKLKIEVPACAVDFNVVSGFCKLQTLKFLDALCRKGINKRLLVRFLPSDISSGATDKEIFEYCKNNGWSIFVDYTIHAKTYIFDKVKCIMGSANATNRGIGSGKNCNKEASAYFTLDEGQYQKVMTLYYDAILLDDELYEYIVSQVEDEPVMKRIVSQRQTKEVIECLMVEDFPNEDSDIIELHNSKAYKWLKTYLEEKEDRSAYFGELSSVIHDIFIKEPRPYRCTIKDCLANLLGSIKKNKDAAIVIIKPNFSEKVSLAK
ncbi:MAG: phospholipase D family protein [Turicibacter sp.]|nr:phospholipase D family protein [Turicibacter sp.]